MYYFIIIHASDKHNISYILLYRPPRTHGCIVIVIESKMFPRCSAPANGCTVQCRRRADTLFHIIRSRLDVTIRTRTDNILRVCVYIGIICTVYTVYTCTCDGGAQLSTCGPTKIHDDSAVYAREGRKRIRKNDGNVYTREHYNY